MLRAAAWTGTLFAVGGGICQLFPGPWIEPLVLIALGATLLLVSGRSPGGARSTAPAEGPVDAAGAETSRTVAR